MATGAQRGLIEGFLPFGGPHLLVVDTGVFYDDIVYRLRHPERRGVLLGSALRGATRLLAADHVASEVYDRLDGFERRGVSRSAVIKCFERDYLPLVRFVDVSAGSTHPRVVAVTDPDDTPTAELAVLLAPSLVLATDSHLVDAGFGRRDDWLSLVWYADDVLAYDGTLMLAAMGARWSLGKLRALSSDLHSQDLVAGLAVGAAILAFLPDAAHVIDGAVRRLGRAAGTLAEGLGGVAVELASERGRRMVLLQDASVNADIPATLEQRLARRLALMHKPQTVLQLRGDLGIDGRDLEHALRSRSAFVETESGWALGRHWPRRKSELTSGR